MDVLALGAYTAALFLEKTGNKDVRVYWKLFKRNTGGTETEILQSAASDHLTDSTSQYVLSGYLNEDQALDTTDRLVFKLYANVSGTGTDVTVKLTMEGDYDSRITINILSSAFNLDRLSDVTITSPADDEVLAYDSGSGRWINQAGGGGAQTPWTSDIDAAGYNLTDLGAGTYFKYVGSDNVVRNWKPRPVQGTKEAFTIYVDGSSGSDANSGSAAAPLATITKAIELLPAHIDHDIYIAVGGPTLSYSGALSFAGLDITARLYIVARDTSDNDLSGYGLATSGGASTLTDSSKSWATNQFADCTVMILRGTGAGQTRTISSNTGTELTVSASWDTNPDNTSYYMIYGPTLAVTSGRAISATGINNVTIQGLNITDSDGEVAYLVTANGWEFYACRFQRTASGVVFFLRENSKASFFSSWIKTHTGANDIGLAVREASSALTKTCHFEAGAANQGTGLLVYRMSTASMDSPRSYFDDFEYGIKAENGGIVTSGSDCVFNSCVTDYSPDAASDPAYIS